MIARTWHGRVPAPKADAYHDYLRHTRLDDYRATPGNRGVLVQRRVDGDVASATPTPTASRTTPSTPMAGRRKNAIYFKALAVPSDFGSQ
jgi:hypothetical protein